MLSGVIFRARHVMIAMGLMAAFLCNASASPNTVTVQSGRPVAEAIQELEKRYGWQITYEDPPYVHYSDITDVTDTDWPGKRFGACLNCRRFREIIVTVGQREGT